MHHAKKESTPSLESNKPKPEFVNLILNSVCSLTGFDEESPVNMERFKATVDKFADLKKTLSYPEHESPGTSPQIPRKKDQKKTGILFVIF